MRRIDLFRAGRHTDIHGREVVFSEEDLAASAAAYDPAVHEAPLVVGHPKLDDPAYGWVARLAATGSEIAAEPRQVNADFAEMVESGAFKKVSASWYPPKHPRNPVPGVWYLRHVGFLGAMPPAIKGLRPVEFSEADDDCVTIEFGERERWGFASIARALRGLREWLIESSGADTADRVLPDYVIRDAEAAAEDDAADTPHPAFSESQDTPESAATAGGAASASPSGAGTPETATPTQEDVHVTPEEAAALQAQNETLTRQVAALTASRTSDTAARRDATHLAFAESLVGDARIAPADVPLVTAMLEFAEPIGESGDLAPVEFGEGEAKQPLAKALREFLSGMPARVEFAELATRERAASSDDGDEDSVDYAEGTDPDRIALDKKIRAHMKAHKVDYATAARAVIK